MKEYKAQSTRYKVVCYILICLCLLLWHQTELFAETTDPAEREKVIEKTMERFPVIEKTMERFLLREMVAPELETDLEYMQAKAYYLYCQGMFEDAILAWEKVLLLDAYNKTAFYYIREAQAKIEARDKPKQQIAEETRGIASMRQKKLGPTQSQYSHTKTSYNEIAPHLKMGENRYFDHSVSIIRNEQKYAIRTKRQTTSIAENIRMDSSFMDYNSTFTASLLHDHTTRDDLRFPRYINFLIENNNFRFLLGDNSTIFSRYVLNGMNYRGIELMMNTSELTYPVDRFKILYGVGKSFDTQSEEYFYPIEIFGMRNEVEVNPRYKFGTSFAYQVHKDKITRVDSLFRPRKNIVGSFDQYIKLADWWVIRHELAYSRLEDETRRITIEEELPTTTDWAHYITSNILKDKWQLYSVYEYGGPNFTSLTGEARFLHNLVLNDKEMFENTFIYTPSDILMFELQYYRLRNNLDSDDAKETTKENFFKGVVRVKPKNWFPAIGFRTSLLRTRSIPGSDDITDKRYARDFGIELTKTLYGIDWNLGYTYQKSIEDLSYKFCDFYRNIYSIRGSTALIPDRTYLNALYSFADLDILLPSGDMDDSAYENKIDASISSRLWGSSNLSLGYHYFNRRDDVGTFEDLDSHTGSFVFMWPYTKEFFNDQKFTITPYLSYYYTQDDEYTDHERMYFASRVDANYYFNPEHKLNLMLEYKDGLDDSNLNQEGEEVRFLATYSSAIGY